MGGGISSPRPSAAVVSPFLGDQGELDALVGRLAAIDRRDGDELIVADNRPSPQPPSDADTPVRWVPAPEVRVAAHPRNVGAGAAGAEWLVFVDADTTPHADLLTRYFDPLPDDGVALLVGGIEDLVLEPTTVSTWIAERDKLDQRWVLEHPRAPWGQTANLAVRRAAFEAAGGFDATIRWGEECDLCWRIQDAGWRLEPRLKARVDHHNRETLRALVRQMSRHGRGTEWLNQRYPGAFPRPGARALAGTARAFARDGLQALRAGDRERAKFSVLDLVSHVAFETGRRLTNEPPRC